MLSSVVKSYKERICSGQSQRPFTGPEYHPFSEMNQMAAHEYSVLPPLGSSEASLQFYQKRASPNQQHKAASGDVQSGHQETFIC